MIDLKPVCWTTETQIAKAQADPGHNMVIWGEPLPYHPDIALVRLSDAEARIKELEAKLADADAMIEAQQHDFAQNNIRNAENAHRVKELEAAKWQVRHVDTANDLVSMGMARDAAIARAEAAEALLKEAGKALEQQRKALEPLSSAVFNDNGDISVSYPVNFTSEHCIAAYFADRAARAVHDKIQGAAHE